MIGPLIFGFLVLQSIDYDRTPYLGFTVLQYIDYDFGACEEDNYKYNTRQVVQRFIYS